MDPGDWDSLLADGLDKGYVREESQQDARFLA